MKQKYIDIFPYYILRTPLISLNDTFKVLSKDAITKENYKNIFNDKIVNEAVFLASPVLHSELKKWFANETTDKKRIKKIQISFLKYLIRASTRCTPFGLFAGVSAGTFNKETKLELCDANSHERSTRLDMNYVVDLGQNLSKDAEIKKRILFYPNNSIYELGSDYRYLEHYYDNGRRKHLVSSLVKTEYLEKIFLKAVPGATFNQLCLVLEELDVDEGLAKEYVDLLIDNGFLVSELEPSVSGPDFLEQILSVLEKIKNVKMVEEIYITLLKVKDKLKNLDKKLGNATELYSEIFDELKVLGTDINEKYLFQTDLKLNLKHNYLSSDITGSIIEAITFLNKITQEKDESRLKIFYKKFINRYGEKEVALTTALDVETGIEYNSSLAGDINTLVDDLSLPGINSTKQIHYNQVNEILLQKIMNAISRSQYKLRLYDKDFDGFEADWSSISSTLFSFVHLVKCDGRLKVVFKSVGGVNGAMLLTRFGHIDDDIKTLVDEIIEYEENEDKNRIYAEVIHLPDSRVGNVLKRPLLRDYEIPYMAKSTLPTDKQLSVQDLFLSAREGRLVLKSKSYNKEVVPRITNAHNFDKVDTLPIYQFLADIQSQNKRTFLNIHNSIPIIDSLEFIPRIEYKDVILHEATWNIYMNDVQKIKSFENSEDKVLKNIEKYRREKQIPRLVKLVENDNQLMIDFENHNSVNLFMDIIKNKKHVVLREFLGAESTVVTNGDDMFYNEMIFAFKNTQTQN